MGAFAGSLTAASLGDYHRKGLLLVIYVLILGASVVSFSASGWYLLSLALMVPLGFGHSGRNVVYETVLQSYAPEHLRGRVLAMRNMQSGLLPVAVLPLSALSQAFGAPLALGVSGSIVLVYALWELLFANTVRRLE
jgi:MFS family permease